MAGEWKQVPLGELYDFSSGLSKPRSEFGFGHGFLSFKDVFYNYFTPPRLKQLVNSTEKEQQSCSIKRGDVFLTRTSETMEELGMSCVALRDYDHATFNGFTKRLRPKSGTQIIPEYAGYFFRSPSFRREVTAMSSLSTRASLNNEMLSRLTMAVPPPATQEKIGTVLKALDDKIELNRRMNATLESMARALFQSWFVDFDPVRAKLDGRQPVGLDPANADLFPEHFEESALGPIPHGWEVGRLDDVLTLQRGFDLPTPNRTHGKYPVMAASGPNGCHDKFMVQGPGVTTGRSGVLGRVFFIHGDFWPLNTSLWVKEFKRVSSAYAFHLLRGLDFAVFNAGSAVPTLNRNHVHNLLVMIPPKPIIEAFDSQVMLLMKLQKANEDQSRTLATLRDTLLPKLLSGELSTAQLTN
jgi:type I restriction enzyme S subunit